jgi:hypothetical protein
LTWLNWAAEKIIKHIMTIFETVSNRPPDGTNFARFDHA